MSKITYEEVKMAVERDHCHLISDSYKNLDTDLEIQCEKGHTFFKKYKSIRKEGCKCPICQEESGVSSKSSISKPKTKEFRILALDQATLNTGWSMWDGVKMVGYGLLKVPAKETSDRIAYMRQWLASMVENNKPDLVILEDIQLQDFHNGAPAYGKFDNVGITTFKVLAKLQGVLENYLVENNIDYKIVFSNTWRAKTGVRGRRRPDKKRSAQLIVNREFGINASEDEADAICIGKYGVLTFTKKAEMISWE